MRGNPTRAKFAAENIAQIYWFAHLDLDSTSNNYFELKDTWLRVIGIHTNAPVWASAIEYLYNGASSLWSSPHLSGMADCLHCWEALNLMGCPKVGITKGCISNACDTLTVTCNCHKIALSAAAFICPRDLGPDSIWICHLNSIGNPIVEIRKS